MNNKLEIVHKIGSTLTDEELLQINKALMREFKVSLPSKDRMQNRLFFLLKHNDEILAMGALLEVKSVIFEGKEYLFHGFVNIVANEKGKGYGKKVVMAMKEYLSVHNLTGLGFCMPKNEKFYEKCGFKINRDITQNFVYKIGSERITNQDGQSIFYQDSSNDFMKKVVTNPGQEVLIPTKDLW